jgi:tRNA(fMet)-specific endonuclease VapC
VTFLLDTNICSAHLRRPSGLIHRFVQHAGRLSVPSIVLGELYTMAYGKADPRPVLQQIRDLLKDVELILFDQASAEEFGRLRNVLKRQGIGISPIDLMIAAQAIAHDLTLVTHNLSDFQRIPELRLEDWLAS